MAGIVANGALGGNDFTLDGAPNRVSPNRRPPATTRRGRLFAALGRDRGVQGPDQRVRRAGRADRRRRREPRAQERRQRVPRELRLLQPRRQPVGDAAAQRAGGRRQADARLQPPHGHLLRPDPAATRPSLWCPTSTCATSSPSPSTLHGADHARCARATCPSSPTLIYDPLHGDRANNQRTPFPGNRVPAAASTPWPRPTRPSTRAQPVRAGGQLLHEHAAALRLQRGAGPHRPQLRRATRCSCPATGTSEQEDRYNWAAGAANANAEGVINGFEVTRGFDYRSNTGVTIGFTSTRSSNLLFDLRGA